MSGTRLRLAGLLTVVSVALAGCGALDSSTSDDASEYPEQEIKIIVPYAAGGSSDGAARAFAQGLSPQIDQPVVVENREGGGAVIGVTEASQAEPDGYTALLTTISPLTTTLFTNPEASYTADDFTGVIGMAELPLMLITPKESPWKTVDDITASGAQSVKYGTTGAGNTIDIANAAIFDHLGVTSTSVPFNSATETLGALLGGQIDATVAEINVAIPAYESGDINILAVSTEERLPELPDVPTWKEVTGDECAVSSSFGLTVPTETPDEVVEALRQDAATALTSDDYTSYLEQLSIRPTDNENGGDWLEYVQSRRDILEQCYNDLFAE